MAILELTNKIFEAFERSSITIGVFTDLKKAFDYIILLDKLNCYGVRGISLSWFQDLNSGCQFVELANCRSPSKLSNVESLRALCSGHSFFSYTLMTSLHLLSYFPSYSLLMTPPFFFFLRVLAYGLMAAGPLLTRSVP